MLRKIYSMSSGNAYIPLRPYFSASFECNCDAVGRDYGAVGMDCEVVGKVCELARQGPLVAVSVQRDEIELLYWVVF